MLFKKEFLQEMEGETIYDKIEDSSRWLMNYERVFKYEEKYYRTFYSCGLTEQQDERPYEYDEEEIECGEVFPVEVTVTVYKSAKEMT